jgi:hypothetical protein
MDEKIVRGSYFGTLQCPLNLAREGNVDLEVALSMDQQAGHPLSFAEFLGILPPDAHEKNTSGLQCFWFFGAILDSLSNLWLICCAI